MNKKTVIYGVSLALLTVLLSAAQYHFIVLSHSIEIYIGLIAIIFVIVGVVMGRKLAAPKEVIIEKKVFIQAEHKAIAPPTETIEKLGISNRELEVLQLMANGLSNQEIADKTFVSVNTIKTHVSNILLKLDAKRRTQAVIRARELNIIA